LLLAYFKFDPLLSLIHLLYLLVSSSICLLQILWSFSSTYCHSYSFIFTPLRDVYFELVPLLVYPTQSLLHRFWSSKFTYLWSFSPFNKLLLFSFSFQHVSMFVFLYSWPICIHVCLISLMYVCMFVYVGNLFLFVSCLSFFVMCLVFFCIFYFSLDLNFSLYVVQVYCYTNACLYLYVIFLCEFQIFDYICIIVKLYFALAQLLAKWRK
jgi:hypothetical protein